MESTSPVSRRKPRGFALLEAILSVAIVAFAFTAIAASKTSLSRGTDDAKFRAEATYLAAQKIEQIRTSTDSSSWDTLASGSDTVTNVTTFTRQWTVSSPDSAPAKQILVTVGWTNRAGETDSVVVHGGIARTDAADGLALTLMPQLAESGPNGRSSAIPFAAVDLGNGTSSYSLPGTGHYIVIDNGTGKVTQECVGGSCSAINGLLLSGYITGVPGKPDCSAYPYAGCTNYATTTFNPEINGRAGGSVLGINLAAMFHLNSANGATDCTYSAATSPAGATIPHVRSYVCLLRLASGQTNWYGKPKLANIQPGFTLCAFNNNGTETNLGYVSTSPISTSLANQNYVISNSACPPTGYSVATLSYQACTTLASMTATCPASQ